NELWDSMAKNGVPDRQRVAGTVPGTMNARFQQFASQYQSQFNGAMHGGPMVFGAAGAYDATYLIAFAAAANGAAPDTGPNLAAAFKRMVSGELLAVGQSLITKAYNDLSTPAGTIDIDGSSGPLNFDLATGEAPSDVQIWCITADANGKA